MPNDSVQRRVLLGVTGSVAAVKAPEIALKILNLHHQRVALKILLTHGGRHFWDQAKIYNKEIWQKFEAVLSEESQKEEPRLILIDSDDEWRQWQTLGDSIMHIDLRNWADLLLCAPLSAHTLAKIRHGMCDDILSSVVRAWDFDKPLILAPAMNTAMWDHVLTGEQLAAVQKFSPHPDRVTVIDPMTKNLACGEHGKGALAPVDEIISVLDSTIQSLAK